MPSILAVGMGFRRMQSSTEKVKKIKFGMSCDDVWRLCGRPLERREGSLPMWTYQLGKGQMRIMFNKGKCVMISE